jgi:PHD/YefM family antitoxin component YafN of YafNO toxin-antitoxin module
MADRFIDIPDLEGEIRDLVSESEVSGRRTIFSRNGRPAVILLSYDEYLAFRETVAIAGSETLRSEIDAAEEQARAGKLLLPEDLLVE